MFTGIIKTTAKIKESHEGGKFLVIEKPLEWDIKEGDSIATNGVCLTVKRVKKGEYETELMPETLSKTSFGKVIPQEVNLETSLKIDGLLGGHLVTGHIDALGRIESIKKEGNAHLYEISFPEEYSKLIAPKGSVTVDGISLTVVDVGYTKFSVSLVDYTMSHTTLGEKKEGDIVNLEFDILAKYISRIVNE